jgi:hypothetical protein
VVDDVVLLEVGEQGGPDVGDVALLAIGDSPEERGSIADGVNQLDLVDVEFLRGLDEDVPGEAFVAQPGGDPLGQFLAVAVGAPGNRDDRNGAPPIATRESESGTQ